jgi:hypothetical protein
MRGNDGRVPVDYEAKAIWQDPHSSEQIGSAKPRWRPRTEWLCEVQDDERKGQIRQFESNEVRRGRKGRHVPKQEGGRGYPRPSRIQVEIKVDRVGRGQDDLCENGPHVS